MFQIIKQTDNNLATNWVHDTVDYPKADAVFLARIYAHDHFSRIMGDTDTYRILPSGARFVTNNGTPVRYFAKEV